MIKHIIEDGNLIHKSVAPEIEIKEVDIEKLLQEEISISLF